MDNNLKPASALRVGHISKAKKGKKYVVKSKKGVHVWAPASENDVKCSKYLSAKIKKLSHEAKSKKASRIKTHDQAVAVAYSMTRKKYPKCGLLNQ